MKKFFLIFLLLSFLIISCSSPKEFKIGEIYLGTYKDNAFQKGIFSAKDNIYVMIDYITGLKILNDHIQPEIVIEIKELNYRESYLGNKINTKSRTISQPIFPIGKLNKGNYTLKITVKDRLAKTRISKEIKISIK